MLLMLLRLLLFARLLGAAGACRPSSFPGFMMGPEIWKALRASRLVPVWPRPNERWLREKRGRNGSPEPWLERLRILLREKLDVEEGVEAAGEGCGASEGDGIECGDGTGGGEPIEEGVGTGGGEGTGGGDRNGGGVLPADAEVLFMGDKESSG